MMNDQKDMDTPSQEPASIEKQASNSEATANLHEHTHDGVEEHSENNIGTDTSHLSVDLPAEIVQSFYSEKSAEARLEKVLNFMQKMMSQGNNHHFKEFWEARKFALNIFKEPIHASVRVQLWAKYSDLCREARRLREEFDEQSAFIAEQIEIAIQAVETDLKSIREKSMDSSEIQELTQSSTISQNVQRYTEIQGELNYLNVFAARLTSLKKELIKSEIRLKVKSKLFQHLANVGDMLFPRRKELIQEVSQLFKQDVETFIQNTFVRDMKTAELFEVREEVKCLQHIAKVLTLNTEVFSITRTELSQCWDTIRDVIQDRKKASNEHKSLMRQHKDELLKEIKNTKQSFEDRTLAPADALAAIKGLQIKMRAMTLAHNDIPLLKSELASFENTVYSILNHEKDEAREKAVRYEQEKTRQVDQIRKNIEALRKKLDEESKNTEISNTHLEEYQAGIETQIQEIEALKLSKSESDSLFSLLNLVKRSLSRLMHQHLVQKAEKATSGNEFDEAIQALIAEKTEVKAELELMRKSQGASGNTITRAMQLNEEIKGLKIRLKEIDDTLQSLQHSK